MPARSRLAATNKRSQYTIPEEDSDVFSTPSKKPVGGVLASLSHNLPRTKEQRGTTKGKESYGISDDLLRTPPPNSIVVDDKVSIFSPLTQPRPARKSDKTTSHGSNGRLSIADDESSMASHTFDQSEQVDKAGDGGSAPFDEDDDMTLERTLVTNDDDSADVPEEEEEGEEESYHSDDSSGVESESYVETESEESEPEPDDDEYVPDDEDDSSSEEDLEDYVEEKPTRPQGRRAKPPPKQVSQPEEDQISFRSESPEEPEQNDENQDPMISSIDKAAVESEAPPIKEDDASVSSSIGEEVDEPVDDEMDDMSDEVPDEASVEHIPEEKTPVKEAAKETADKMTPTPKVPCTPESLFAVVVDDEEDVEDDVLVATIIDQEEDDPPANELADTIETETQAPSSPALSTHSPMVVSEERRKSTKSKKSQRKSFFRAEGTIKRGKWALGSKIGVGSFGVVHVGMNNETGKLMAVKKFKVEESAMKDIRTEVQLMRSLKHKNIVRYLGAQMDKRHLHIFQEWVPGGSVATLLSRFGPFGAKVIRSYLAQTLEGLSYLHDNDIMHRDIKGSNILVNDEGVVKLADFGASKKLANLKDNLLMSLTVRGTPYFMAPEVFEEKYSAKADVWGIGCVAHQMITGSPPWKELGFGNPISLFNHIKKHDGRPIIDAENEARLKSDNISSVNSLFSFLDACFDKDPNSRPSAHELLDHPFFLEVHDDADDETVYSRGLFSPSNETAASWVSRASPSFERHRSVESPALSPRHLPVASPQSESRRMSAVKWKKTFASPQRPKRLLHNKKSSKANDSPMRSPAPDAKEWPEWAREELRKKKTTEDSHLPFDEMGSLALSEDSASMGPSLLGRPSQAHATTVDSITSNLAGMKFLDNTATYEI